MDSNRDGEHCHTPYRSRRLYSANGQWYFDTREKKQFGPYRDKSEAKKALAIFVAKQLRDLNADRLDNRYIRHGAEDGVEYMVEELLEFFGFRNDKGETAALAWAIQRRDELRGYGKNISNIEERMDVLKYAMDQE